MTLWGKLPLPPQLTVTTIRTSRLGAAVPTTGVIVQARMNSPPSRLSLAVRGPGLKGWFFEDPLRCALSGDFRVPTEGHACLHRKLAPAFPVSLAGC